MTKRPLCLVCLFLMLFLVAGDWLGFPFVRGNPLPDHLKRVDKRAPGRCYMWRSQKLPGYRIFSDSQSERSISCLQIKKNSNKKYNCIFKEKRRIKAGNVSLRSRCY